MFQHLGRHADAIADCQELVLQSEKSGRPSRQNALNGLAYARALAGVELDAALADADAALASARADLKDAEETMKAAVNAKKNIFEASELLAHCRSSIMACVDTRGLVHFKKGDFAAAQGDFDEAVKRLQQVREFMHDHKKYYSTKTRDYKSFAKVQGELDHNDAVIYYHRSLNLKELGRDEDAARDWKKATELLGREPDDDLF
jgi:tetratricopeptide (TPR) repeat protein